MNARKLVPYAAAALALAGVGVTLLPRTEVRGCDVEGYARLPVLEGGRVKPIDAIARNMLLVILFRPDVADRQPVFQIDDPEVLGLIGLPQPSQRRFPFTALLPYVSE